MKLFHFHKWRINSVTVKEIIYINLTVYHVSLKCAICGKIKDKILMRKMQKLNQKGFGSF
jgi:hypothetical protein